MKPVIVKKSGIERKGVFANKNFKKGETILKWNTSKIIDKKDVKKLSKDEQNHTSPTGNGRYIIMQSPERYVNHSCNPNTYVKNRKDVALRNIKKGEEITTDYSISGIDNWRMKCFCGSNNCRKIVYGNFFKLPKKLQKKYLPYLEIWFKKKFEKRLKELKK